MVLVERAGDQRLKSGAKIENILWNTSSGGIRVRGRRKSSVMKGRVKIKERRPK